MSSPLCQYYEQCGGCTLQHLPLKEYTSFKHAILLNAINRLGCDEALANDLVHVGARSRRRAEFKVSVSKGDVSFGFFEAKSHNVVDIEDCPVTCKSITNLIPLFRSLIESMKKKGLVSAIHITEVHDGFDVYLHTKAPLPDRDKQLLLDFCENNKNILRFSLKTEDEDPVVTASNGSVNMLFSDIAVELPLQPFLQATEAGQNAITTLILEHTRDAHRVADLYCGCGTYSFPMAQRGQKIAAFEGSYNMVTAANNAARNAEIEHQISIATQDLYKSPIRSADLASFDAVVINPPRNGAAPQTKEIAKSKVGKVVMVSCNPSTFERDAKILLSAGYRLTSATPIDQFFQTNHLELVAAFEI